MYLTMTNLLSTVAPALVHRLDSKQLPHPPEQDPELDLDPIIQLKQQQQQKVLDFLDLDPELLSTNQEVLVTQDLIL